MTKKKVLVILVSLLCLLTACVTTDSNEDDIDDGGDDPNVDTYTLPSNPNFSSHVTAHDPSIFNDDGTYYTFGSHFAVTRSDNLIHWTQVAGDNGADVLYGDISWREVLSDALEYVPNAGSTWAPAVVKFGQTYYMYYSLSTFGSSVSYIGRVEADSVTGPYRNSVEIVKSDGMGGPNAIDPEIFFDQEGKLWMVYGSFFAGIYIKELYAQGDLIGLPKEDGYGKKLWAGGSTGPEGPYIFYNADTDFYYLMVSHGSLSTNYNMRVARSKSPDGPYLDARGQNVENMQNGGVKLAGNYQFEGYQTGYAALGHNSVIQIDNEYFVVYHTRYRQGQSGVTGMHHQYINQLFFNENGWPVLAPNRYAGEKTGVVNMQDASGVYDILIHTADNSEAFATSNQYTFTANGDIQDDEDQIGTWSITDDYYITIQLGLLTYHGVVVPQWHNDLNKAGLSIAAISRNGISLWANQR